MKKNQFISQSGKSRRRFLGDLAKGVGLAAIGSGLTKNVPALTTPVVQSAQPFGFVIHGGVGTLARSAMTPELE